MWTWIGRVSGAIGIAALAYLAFVPTGRYLVRAAIAEGKILHRRRPIVDMIADSSTPPDVRQKLRLVQASRTFAVDSIHLVAKESFTTYSQLDHDTLVMVLSGAYPDRLLPYTWWFPIVGRVPYKGYFDFSAARDAEKKLAGQGYDAYLRPSSAFSTLGWFNDPLLSTTLHADTLYLANTVIHELTHNTFYAPGSAVFNESFANFVGARGSAWLFRTRGSPAEADLADKDWADEKLFAGFWQRTYASIDSAFKAHPTDSLARIRARDTVYASARQYLVDSIGPKLSIPATPQQLRRVRLDNAALLARRIYDTDLDLFDAVWVRENQNLPNTVTKIIELAKSDAKDPFGAMRRWLADSPTQPTK